MTLLIAALWPGSLAAFALGLAIGWYAGWPAGRAIPAAFGLAALALAAIAVAGLVPGIAGLWLESALFILIPYPVGCALGALAGRSNRARRVDPPAS